MTSSRLSLASTATNQSVSMGVSTAYVQILHRFDLPNCIVHGLCRHQDQILAVLSPFGQQDDTEGRARLDVSILDLSYDDDDDDDNTGFALVYRAKLPVSCNTHRWPICIGMYFYDSIGACPVPLGVGRRE